jgi:hypothetical protein
VGRSRPKLKTGRQKYFLQVKIINLTRYNRSNKKRIFKEKSHLRNLRRESGFSIEA